VVERAVAARQGCSSARGERQRGGGDLLRLAGVHGSLGRSMVASGSVGVAGFRRPWLGRREVVESWSLIIKGT
jgi:hypothetical protein